MSPETEVFLSSCTQKHIHKVPALPSVCVMFRALWVECEGCYVGRSFKHDMLGSEVEVEVGRGGLGVVSDTKESGPGHAALWSAGK